MKIEFADTRDFTTTLAEAFGGYTVITTLVDEDSVLATPRSNPVYNPELYVFDDVHQGTLWRYVRERHTDFTFALLFPDGKHVLLHRRDAYKVGFGLVLDAATGAIVVDEFAMEAGRARRAPTGNAILVDRFADDRAMGLRLELVVEEGHGRVQQSPCEPAPMVVVWNPTRRLVVAGEEIASLFSSRPPGVPTADRAPVATWYGIMRSGGR